MGFGSLEKVDGCIGRALLCLWWGKGASVYSEGFCYGPFRPYGSSLCDPTFHENNDNAYPKFFRSGGYGRGMGLDFWGLGLNDDEIEANEFSFNCLIR